MDNCWITTAWSAGKLLGTYVNSQVIANFNLQKPCKAMVGCQQPVTRGYTAVAPPPFVDLLWGRGREGWVQSQNAINLPKEARHT